MLVKRATALHPPGCVIEPKPCVSHKDNEAAQQGKQDNVFNGAREAVAVRGPRLVQEKGIRQEQKVEKQHHPTFYQRQSPRSLSTQSITPGVR